MKKIISGLLIILSLTSCVHRLTDFTIISTKNISMDANRGKRVKGEDCSLMILFIPVFGKLNPDLKDAIDNAIEGDNGWSTVNFSKNSSEKTTGNALIDGVIYTRYFGIPPLFFHSCYIAEGNLVTK
jgi:hypothetical protein